MDLSSPYFPVRVKQEPMDNGYDAPPQYQQQQPPPSHMYPQAGEYGGRGGAANIKPEPPETPSSTYSHTIAEADSAGMQLEAASGPKKRGRKKKKIKQEAENG